MQLMQLLLLGPGRLEKWKQRGRCGHRRKAKRWNTMFQVLPRKKNAGIHEEAAEEEPSSPEVTCMGQVRDKSKQQKGRERLKRWGGQVFGFRKAVCNGLRILGLELDSFLPCSRSSPKEEEHGEQQPACWGTVLAKWFTMFQVGEEKQHGKLDLEARIQEKSGIDGPIRAIEEAICEEIRSKGTQLMRNGSR